MEEFDSLLEECLSEVERTVKDYEDYLENKFNIYSLNNSDTFYSFLNRKTKQAQDSCIDSIISCFKKICLAAGIPLFKDVFSLLYRSTKTYVKHAFSQYKSVYTSLYAKTRERLSEANLREALFKDVLKSNMKVRDFMLGKEDIVISVGKRSFHLSSYLRLVAEQEVRNKFNTNLFKEARKNGAIGIRISDHNTKTKLCDQYEGKTYYFANNGLAALKDGLPPFHINCKHFIIPIYENN